MLELLQLVHSLVSAILFSFFVYLQRWMLSVRDPKFVEIVLKDELKDWVTIFPTVRGYVNHCCF